MDKEIAHLHTKIGRSKFAVYLIIGFLALLTYLLIVVSRGVSNEQAVNLPSQASEIADQSSDQLSYTPISIEETGIDLSTIEQQATPQGCNYAAFMGFDGQTRKLVCKDENRPGGLECSYAGTVLCLDTGDAHPISIDYCAEEEDWNDIAENICCSNTASICSATVYPHGRKEYCDAICRKASCVPQVDNGGDWGWYCPLADNPKVCPIKGGQDILPVVPPNPY